MPAGYDGRLLRAGLLDATSTGAGVWVWAVTACRSVQNEAWVQRHGFISHIHRHRPNGWPLPAHIRRSNARRSHDRALVEHVFAVQKQAMGLARARTRIGMANLAYYFWRPVQLQGRVTA